MGFLRRYQKNDVSVSERLSQTSAFPEKLGKLKRGVGFCL